MEIPDEDVENFKTVGDVVNYVKAHHEGIRKSAFNMRDFILKINSLFLNLLEV